MAISFLQDIVVNNQLTVGTSATASSGSRLDLFTGSIGFHSNGTDVGSIFNNGVNFFINSGASGGTVNFGAPTTYTQNVDIQGGYLSVGNYLDIEGSLIKMDVPGTTTSVDVIKYESVTIATPYLGGSNLVLGDVAEGDQVENIDLKVMGNVYLQVQDDALVSKADSLTFSGTLGSSAITQFWGLDAGGVVQKRTKAQFASDAGIVRTTTSQTIAGDKTFSGATTFTNSITQTGGGTTTLSGDLDVQGSGISLVDDITFSGSGRIQGLASPSSGTDAANKSYVDAHPSGTVTSVALSGGTGISISGSPITGSGTITVTNSAPDQTVALTGGTGISISGTYPNFTITNSSPSSGGTVTSVGMTVAAGLDVSGSPITGSGSFALSLDLSELSATTTMVASDEFIVLDNDAERKIEASDIGLSIFNNDAGFTTNSGTVTSVATGDGLSGGTITTSGTLTVDSTVVRTSGNQTIAGVKTFSSRIDAANADSIRADKIRTYGGQQLVLNAGESNGQATGQTNEYVYINAEQGLQINSSPDNWASGWAGRNTTTINDADGNSTFANDITVSGGDITLGGTGRIQGVDTVSASTDAANKAYVDAHPGSGGTVTSVAVSAGTGISVSGSPITTSGTITVTNSAPDQTVALTAGTGISVSGTYPNFTITNSSPSSGGTMSNWKITADNGGTATIDDAETVDIAGGTNINTARSGNTITINNEITNNNQLTNGQGFTTNTGTTTASNTQTFTNKSGNISQWTNDSGYLTSAGSMSNWKLTADSGGTATIDNAETVDIAGGTSITTARSGNTVTITNSAPDQTVALSGGTGITISGTYPNFTITNSSPGSGTSGTVTSVSAGEGLEIESGSSTVNPTIGIDYTGTDNLVLAAPSGSIGATSSMLFNQSNNAYRVLLSDVGLSRFDNDAGFTSNTGDITAVVAGAGLTGGATSGSATLNLDVDGTNNYIEMNNDVTPVSGDFVPFSDISASNVVRKTTFSDIPLSILNNDAGFVTSSGVTSVGATAPVTSTGGTTPTIGVDTAAVTNGGSKLATGDQIYDFVGGWTFSAGGGDVTGTAQLGQSVILTMATVNSNVGSFTNANITVDGKGRITAASSGSSGVTGLGTANFLSKWGTSSTITNSEISDTGSVIQLGLDASNNSTLYLDTVNRKVGFRTTSPGAAFDVNGTIRVRNQLNVGDTTEQNLYVDGNANPGGKYVKMGNYGGSTGNYFGLTDAVNQPKFSAAFGSGGKIVQDKRIITVKIAASALNGATSDNGKIIIPNPGANSVLWPTNIFIYRGSGQPGSGWASGNTAGAVFYFCPSGNCGQRRIITVMAGGVCSTASEWYWGRPVPLPTINENPTVVWDGLKNQALRFRTSTTVSNATMNWYVRIEYLKINVTAGFVNNVDTTVT